MLQRRCYRSRFTVTKENVDKAVGATSSEVFLIYCFRKGTLETLWAPAIVTSAVMCQKVVWSLFPLLGIFFQRSWD